MADQAPFRGQANAKEVKLKSLAQALFLRIATVCACLTAANLVAQPVSFVRRDIVAPLSPRDVFVADLNADGNADLVVNNVALLGYGDGTFGPPLKFAADAEERDHGVRAVVLTDLNSDGKPDLVLSDNS